jgi:ClpP class serine protease
VIIDDVRRRLGSVSVSSSHDYYDSACNIAVLKLEGELMSYIPWSELDEYMKPIYDETSAEKLVSAINNASTSRYIDAIILQIDSR